MHDAGLVEPTVAVSHLHELVERLNDMVAVLLLELIGLEGLLSLAQTCNACRAAVLSHGSPERLPSLLRRAVPNALVARPRQHSWDRALLHAPWLADAGPATGLRAALVEEARVRLEALGSAGAGGLRWAIGVEWCAGFRCAPQPLASARVELSAWDPWLGICHQGSLPRAHLVEFSEVLRPRLGGPDAARLTALRELYWAPGDGADELRALVQTRADGSILLQCVPAARDREGSAQYAARVARAPSWLRLRLTPGEALRGAFWVHSRHARREWPTG